MDETQDIPIRESIQNDLVKAIRGDNASIENLVNLLTEMYENVNTNPSVQDTTEKEQELLNRVHELEHSIVLLEMEVTNLKFDLAQTDWLSGGFTPCRHLRPSSGREHTNVTYSVR